MESLRDLANDLKSNKNTTNNFSQGLNTYAHTSNKPSIDQKYSTTPFAGKNMFNLQVGNQTQVATMALASPQDEGNTKLEPILEEKYLHRQPETTKHESNTGRDLPTAQSNNTSCVELDPIPVKDYV